MCGLKEILKDVFIMKDKKILECFKFDLQLFAEPGLTQVDGVYLITSVADMKTLAGYINAGNNCNGKTFKLTNDLDFSDRNYTPIVGNFKGTFDGNGHTIRNITCSVNSNYVGLFGTTKNATIKNVNLDKCTFKSSYAYTSGYIRIGSIVGEAIGGTIINCHVTDGKINIRDQIICDYTQIGGIAGYSNGTIEKSSYEGEVSDSAKANDHRVGGIVGDNNGEVTESVAQASVKCESSDSKYKYVGGIVGWNGSGGATKNNLFVSKGLNTGNYSYLGAIS